MENNNERPKCIYFNETPKNKKIDLIVNGQGVFVFDVAHNHNNNNKRESAYFILHNKIGHNELMIEFNVDSVKMEKIEKYEKLIDPNNTQGLSDKKGAYYWFSIDYQNQLIQAGIGETRVETVIYKYKFSHDDKAFLRDIHTIELLSNNISPLKLLRDPITYKIPLKVHDIHELTMSDIDNSRFMPKSFLTNVSKIMYECIAGRKFVLDDQSFPEFSKAIQYSIQTPGCWCNKTLQKKSREFNKDKPNLLETYLRITLGQNNGESPGIPYVMEIWPIGHYSPVHSHSNANAVIRVLHGAINVKLFPFLCCDADGVKEFGESQFKKNDITWISAELNQIHQLKNLETNKEPCITIQCYMYDNEDDAHYDYFDYIDANGNKQQYEPDSDMDFTNFKEMIKGEWKNRPRCNIFSSILGRKEK